MLTTDRTKSLHRSNSIPLFLFLFSLYLLTYAPDFHSSDGLAMFATAESLARRGAWDIEQIRWMDLQQGTYGLDGLLYSRKGIGQPLLALPLTWLGLVLPGLGVATTTLLFGAIVTALSGAFLQRYLVALGYGQKTGLVAALVFGLGTLAWPYAKTFFSDPLTGLLLLLSACAAWRYRQSGQVRYTVGAGAAVGWAVATRYAEGVMLLPFGLLLLAYAYAVNKRIEGFSPLRPDRAKALNTRLKRLVSFLVQPALIGFAAPIALIGLSLLGFNWRRYGDPFNTGYLPQEGFTAVWWQGILGQLVSPGRGLLLYAPVLIYSLVGARGFIRRHRAEGWLALAVILGHLLLYGKWFMWHGGFAWGPRFMVPTLPFWVMLLAPALERIFPALADRQPGSVSSAAQRPARLLFLLILAASIVLQIPGVAVDFERWQGYLLDTGLPLFAPITFFAARYSPLLGTWGYLRLETLDFAWTAGGRLDVLLLAALVVLVLAQGWNLVARRPRPLPAAGLTLLVTGLLLVRVHARQPADLAAALARIEAAGAPEEALIYNDPELAVPLAELYRGRGQVLGLALGGPPLPGSIARRLEQITQAGPQSDSTRRQVWWLPNWLPPTESGVEQYLLATGYRLEEQTLGEQRLVRFAYPAGGLPAQDAPPVAFEGVWLDEAAFASVASAGQPFLLELHWRAEAPLDADLRVFTQLLDAEGGRLAGSDGQPVNWTRPTTGWPPGETIIDRHAFLIPADAPTGSYRLIAGLYDPASGRRLLTATEAEFAVLGSIRLP
ncbi:MAG: hypothetical protein ACE5H9_16495 [Anaerolineae bacterium]